MSVETLKWLSSNQHLELASESKASFLVLSFLMMFLIDGSWKSDYVHTLSSPQMEESQCARSMLRNTPLPSQIHPKVRADP